jgi:hypothetical protein
MRVASLTSQLNVTGSPCDTVSAETVNLLMRGQAFCAARFSTLKGVLVISWPLAETETE